MMEHRERGKASRRVRAWPGFYSTSRAQRLEELTPHLVPWLMVVPGLERRRLGAAPAQKRVCSPRLAGLRRAPAAPAPECLPSRGVWLSALSALSADSGQSNRRGESGKSVTAAALSQTATTERLGRHDLSLSFSFFLFLLRTCDLAPSFISNNMSFMLRIINASQPHHPKMPHRNLNKRTTQQQNS